MATFAGHILGDLVYGQDWDQIGNCGGIIGRMHQGKTDMFGNLFNQKAAGSSTQNLFLQQLIDQFTAPQLF